MKKIILFDLDDTLCDYSGSVEKALSLMMAPGEKPYRRWYANGEPDHIKERRHAIINNENWWVDLPIINHVYDLYTASAYMGYEPIILTAGPSHCAAAWSGKKKWVDRYFGPEAKMIVTRDKGVVYGDVLVDDYPKYFQAWLKRNEKGIVLCPSGPQNESVKNKRVTRFGVEHVDAMIDRLFKLMKGKK